MNKNRMDFIENSKMNPDQSAQNDWLSTIKGWVRGVFKRSLAGTSAPGKPVVDVRYRKKIKKADGTKVKYKVEIKYNNYW